MKKLALASFASLLFVATWLSGCMNREPAPICPVPIQVAATDLRITGYDGVDMIIVIDNSGSMAEEQEILATGFFTMINALVNPVSAQDVAASADDIRVAVVTSDLGLQYSGKPGPVTGTSSVTGCSAMGDDGTFQTYASGLSVSIQSNEIDCVAGGNQCPNAQWTCEAGKCRAPGTGPTAPCPSLAGTYAELTPQNNNDNLAFQVACMAQQSTKGCGIEQQLESAVVGLKKHPSFVRPNYLLAVLIVSDEEDCSVKEKGLFDTPEWKEKITGLNTACNYPESNETEFLYTIERYKEEYSAIKVDDPNAVVFAAIVGVPHENTLCQGRGNQIGQACLDSNDMTIEKKEFTDPVSGQKYWHFRSACVRDDDPSTPVIETEAKPGRRYVQLARTFGEKGYVYSICNKDWGPAMKEIAGLIASQLGGTCYTDPLDWDPVNRVARCDVVANYSNNEQGKACPAELVNEWIKQNEGKGETDYYAIVQRTPIYDETKSFVSETVACPLAKIPAALSCADAEKDLETDDLKNIVGWYYCEDNRVDTDSQACPIKVQLTDAAQNATKGVSIAVQCLQQFSFEDINCQENTPEACSNGIDDDGNSVFDCCQNLPDVAPTSKVCDIDQGENYHLPDPNCCPMTVDKEGVCQPNVTICGGGGPGNWPDACVEAAKRLPCELP